MIFSDSILALSSLISSQTNFLIIYILAFLSTCSPTFTFISLNYFDIFFSVGEKSFDYKNFHDDSWWEVADDYGRSLYSELSMLISEAEDKRKVKELVASKISDWSSHSGRRNMRVLSDISSHELFREGSNARMLAGIGGSISRMSISREGSVGRFFSSHGDREKNVSTHDSDEKKTPGYGSKKALPLTKIDEKDLESGDYIPNSKAPSF